MTANTSPENASEPAAAALPPAAETTTTTTTAVPSPPARPDYNLTGVDFRRPMPRPKVRGPVIDFHCHLLARHHGPAWFEAADHYGIDYFLTMTPLEEAVGIQRDWGHRVNFIAVPRWGPGTPGGQAFVDDYRVRLDGFYNLGSRMIKFHVAPGTLVMRGVPLDSPMYEPMFREIVDRRMAVMTHVGDPELWYAGKYADTAKYGTRAEHYAMWERVLQRYPQIPWVGAHLAGNPENLGRLQDLLDRYPQLMLDCSATRWMVREVSARRDAAREFFVRNQDRLIFGSDQVSGDDRGFDFLASRFWAHRKLWETAYIGPSPIADPDLLPDQQPTLRGLALPDGVLQKLYHDNAVEFLAKVGMTFGGWG